MDDLQSHGTGAVGYPHGTGTKVSLGSDFWCMYEIPRPPTGALPVVNARSDSRSDLESDLAFTTGRAPLGGLGISYVHLKSSPRLTLVPVPWGYPTAALS